MKVMGIVNATPDSFSDGGECLRTDDAVRRAFRHAADGADIVDIGGESTRPGAVPVSWDTEWGRIAPILDGIHGIGCAVSVDTYHPETAERALKAGAGIVNCVYPETVPAMIDVISRTSPNAELVVPASCLDICRAAGMMDRTYLDPMIGFGTTREEDLALLHSVGVLAEKGRVLVGASRKRIVRALSKENDTGALLGADIAVALWSASHGASVVRVHDVKPVAQALRVYFML